MKKLIVIGYWLLVTSIGSLGFSSCTATGGGGTTTGGGGVTGVVTSVEAWLADPANQALISAIEKSALAILPLFAVKPHQDGSDPIVAKLAVKYPNVPAGALTKIAQKARQARGGG